MRIAHTFDILLVCFFGQAKKSNSSMKDESISYALAQKYKKTPAGGGSRPSRAPAQIGKNLDSGMKTLDN
jgi:hypothetical protein